MAPLAGLTIEEATDLTDIHDTVQAQAGTTTWVLEFSPMIEGSCKFVAEALLWLLHSRGLCCATVEEFAAYMGENIVSQPEPLRIRSISYTNGVAWYRHSLLKKIQIW